MAAPSFAAILFSNLESQEKINFNHSFNVLSGTPVKYLIPLFIKQLLNVSTAMIIVSILLNKNVNFVLFNL